MESNYSRKKKIVFWGIAIVFTLVMIGFTWDFMRKTTRPGSKKHLPESIKQTP